MRCSPSHQSSHQAENGVRSLCRLTSSVHWLAAPPISAVLIGRDTDAKHRGRQKRKETGQETGCACAMGRGGCRALKGLWHRYESLARMLLSRLDDIRLHEALCE
jgi:hypothetical protein